MQTSSYFGKNRYKGEGRIGITAFLPRNLKDFEVYKALAPRRNMIRGMTVDQYLHEYGKILERLDPQKTWDDLHELVEPHEPVLLCYEKPPFTPQNWCHRRLVARWFKATLGHDVLEYKETPATSKTMGMLHPEPKFRF